MRLRTIRNQLISRRFEACRIGFGSKTIAASKWQGPLRGIGGAISKAIHDLEVTIVQRDAHGPFVYFDHGVCYHEIGSVSPPLTLQSETGARLKRSRRAFCFVSVHFNRQAPYFRTRW